MRTHAQNKNGHNIQPGKGKHMKDRQVQEDYAFSTCFADLFDGKRLYKFDQETLWPYSSFPRTHLGLKKTHNP